MKIATILPLCFALTGLAFAQDQVRWDNSGNNLLKGKYRFREVAWTLKNAAGDFARATSMNGTLEFDGEGNFTLNALVLDSNVGSLQRFNKTGVYRIAASGMGFVTSPIFDDGLVFGLVSNGVFIGSSTEDGINDMFIAAKESDQAVTNADFRGRYKAVELNMRGTGLAQSRGSSFDLVADGQGALSPIAVTGYIGGSTRRLTQTVSGAQYSFTNSEGSLRYGGTLTDTNFLTGDRVFYMSADRSFIFGGSSTGFDLFVGAPALTADAPASLPNGLFYEAGVDVSLGGVADGEANLYTFSGGIRYQDGDVWGHQRLFTGLSESAYDYTYSDFYELNASGSYEDFFGFRNMFCADGKIRIGFGQESTVGLHIGLRAPTLDRAGTFLNPTGVVNAASRTPFTVGTAPGTLLLLQGKNLAAADAEDAAFPTTLGGVQVLFNGKAAPIQKVSGSQIVVQTPYDLPIGVTEIQVMNNGEASNKVTAYVNTSAPGVFTEPAAGVGYARAFHGDGTAVTTSNPAKIGETVSVHVAGLAEVDPAVVAGTPGPEPASAVVQPVAAYLDGDEAPVRKAFLTTGLIGVYTVQVEIIPGLSGSAYLDIATPDAYTTMVVVPVVKGASENGLELQTRGAEFSERRVTNRRGRPTHLPQRNLTGTAPVIRNWNERNHQN
ncbi:MAG: IPT/TIG domain-containing protein [Bryobacteraceae bacterium]